VTLDADGVGVAIDGVGEGDGRAAAVDGVGLGRTVGTGTCVRTVVGDRFAVGRVPAGRLDVRLGPALGRVVRCVVVGAGVGVPPVEEPPGLVPSGRSAAMPVPTTMASRSPNSAIMGRDIERCPARGTAAVLASPSTCSGAVGGRW
jgi:hypothetical protein